MVIGTDHHHHYHYDQSKEMGKVNKNTRGTTDKVYEYDEFILYTSYLSRPFVRLYRLITTQTETI